MKWLIASDIHGSAYFCEKLIEAYKRENADKILLLGDVLYHGPRNDLPEGYAPKQVIVMLNELAQDILCVRGNCDAEVDQMVLDFPLMADYAIITEDVMNSHCAKGSKEDGQRIRIHMIYATHGHIYNNGNLPPLHKGDILLHGHTHVPACEQYETHTYINPGSVSIPKEGSPHSYMVFDGEVFEWKTLDGEVYREFLCKAKQNGTNMYGGQNQVQNPKRHFWYLNWHKKQEETQKTKNTSIFPNPVL